MGEIVLRGALLGGQLPLHLFDDALVVLIPMLQSNVLLERGQHPAQ